MNVARSYSLDMYRILSIPVEPLTKSQLSKIVEQTTTTLYDTDTDSSYIPINTPQLEELTGRTGNYYWKFMCIMM